MSQSSKPDVNSWLEEELFQQYQHNSQTVDESWREVFDTAAPTGNGAPAPSIGNGAPAPVANTVVQPSAPAEKPAAAVASHQQLTPLRGAAARIATNMSASLAVPTATSQRIIPVKVMEENRRIINQHRALTGQGKISFSHILAFAIVRAL